MILAFVFEGWQEPMKLFHVVQHPWFGIPGDNRNPLVSNVSAQEVLSVRAG
jgi:hypothetical protein